MGPRPPNFGRGGTPGAASPPLRSAPLPPARLRGCGCGVSAAAHLRRAPRAVSPAPCRRDGCAVAAAARGALRRGVGRKRAAPPPPLRRRRSRRRASRRAGGGGSAERGGVAAQARRAAAATAPAAMDGGRPAPGVRRSLPAPPVPAARRGGRCAGGTARGGRRERRTGRRACRDGWRPACGPEHRRLCPSRAEIFRI